MNRKFKKALDRKMQVKLPESLGKDNILSKIDTPEIRITENPRKNNMVKRLVPLAASLMLVAGLIGIYFGTGMNEKKEEYIPDDKTDVMHYQSYDAVYEKFDELHETAKKNNIYNGFRDMVAATDDILTGGIPEASPDSATNGSAETGKTKEEQYGVTNTQESGVDEGDIIKTDGDYLYVVNSDSNRSVSVVSLADKKMAEVSQIDFDSDETVCEIYISGDKLVAVGNLADETDGAELEKGRYYTVGCVGFAYADTFVKEYDIADRNNPELISEYSQQGSYESSRVTDSKLYVISEYRVDIYGEDYRDNCIPETVYNGAEKQIEPSNIHVLLESDSPEYAVITTRDLTKNSEPESQAVLGSCENLYASTKGLFLAETESDDKGQQFTKIYKFNYTDTGLKHMCTGKVDGYLNNQFSMSYDGEYFRVATTVNKVEESDNGTFSSSLDNRMNNLYILNNNMAVAGKVEDLAKGETIESVRFVGDMAYVVTFRQTDPLFVIDLSDHENPTVKGELKIPGFSEYLHPIADGFLVGVGQDGTESGTNGDCKVSLFDVTNPYEPEESSVLTVADGKGYCYTEVGQNHKLYINLSENEFAVPFVIHGYVNNIKTEKSGDYYIRYRLSNDGLCEVSRYYVGGDESDVTGATYVGDVFYVVTNNYGKGTYITAFDLNSHEQLGSLQTSEWQGK